MYGAFSTDDDPQLQAEPSHLQTQSINLPVGESTKHPLTLEVDANGQYSGIYFRERQQQRLAAAYSKLHQYSTSSFMSRPASPRSHKTETQYLDGLGSFETPVFDTLVINTFIGHFQTHVAPMFPCFQNFRISASTPEEVYLAMAATGGLYCKTPKSDMVAKWLLHTARRKLLTVVSETFKHQLVQTFDGKLCSKLPRPHINH